MSICISGTNKATHPKNQMNQRGDFRVVPRTGLMAAPNASGKQTQAPGMTQLYSLITAAQSVCSKLLVRRDIYG